MANFNSSKVENEDRVVDFDDCLLISIGHISYILTKNFISRSVLLHMTILAHNLKCFNAVYYVCNAPTVCFSSVLNYLPFMISIHTRLRMLGVHTISSGKFTCHLTHFNVDFIHYYI